jgi:hypothetical protein
MVRVMGTSAQPLAGEMVNVYTELHWDPGHRAFKLYVLTPVTLSLNLASVCCCVHKLKVVICGVASLRVVRMSVSTRPTAVTTPSLFLPAVYYSG